ncbi:MAG: (2Fe-2S)-binding protein [Candidatus Sericytochromatia bacterium]|nr:(2Fe-2S)-binding protein [Candidatus Sericytochromatia bacterium]
MRIDRCICFQKTFAELKAIAQAHNAESVEALQQYVSFAQKCRLCRPYVAEMLRSGQTVFTRLLSPSDADQI